MHWLCAVALAADWPLAQGTEVDRPDQAVSVGGFVQLEAGVGVGAQTVTGLSAANAAMEGKVPTFNEGTTPWLTVRRARLITRGSVPGTGRRVSWFLAAELGRNGLTRDVPAQLADASLTWTLAPAAHVRVGRFKLPTAEEALELQPLAAEGVAFSEPVRTLLIENTIVDGRYVGPASAFRDVGVQWFGTAPLADVRGGTVSVSYAAMVSNGGATVDPHFDLTVRGKLAWAQGSPVAFRRDEISAWGWIQRGARTVDDGDATITVGRARAGVGAQVEHRGTRVMAEVILARGAIELGNDLPFGGQPQAVAPRGEAIGAVLTARQMVGRWGMIVRWAGLWRGADAPGDLRIFQTFTPGLRYEPTPRTQIELNYERRSLAAPHGTADARAIGDAMADRLLWSSTVVF